MTDKKLKVGDRVYWLRNFGGYSAYKHIKTGDLICTVDDWNGEMFVTCYLWWKKGTVPKARHCSYWTIPRDIVIKWKEQIDDIDGDYYA